LDELFSLETKIVELEKDGEEKMFFVKVWVMAGLERRRNDE
jgi:hypothetical protein